MRKFILINLLYLLSFLDSFAQGTGKCAAMMEVQSPTISRARFDSMDCLVLYDVHKNQYKAIGTLKTGNGMSLKVEVNINPNGTKAISFGDGWAYMGPYAVANFEEGNPRHGRGKEGDIMIRFPHNLKVGKYTVMVGGYLSFTGRFTPNLNSR